jgi:hypothetical protein
MILRPFFVVLLLAIVSWAAIFGFSIWLICMF